MSHIVETILAQIKVPEWTKQNQDNYLQKIKMSQWRKIESLQFDKTFIPSFRKWSYHRLQERINVITTLSIKRTMLKLNLIFRWESSEVWKFLHVNQKIETTKETNALRKDGDHGTGILQEITNYWPTALRKTEVSDFTAHCHQFGNIRHTYQVS